MLAVTSAVTLLSMPMLVSFRRMVIPPRMRISDAVALGDDPQSQADELRAHLEVRALDLEQVDVEADEVVFQLEGDHPSAVRETVHLAHGENAGSLQGLQDLRQAGPLRRANEQDLGLARRLGGADPADLH